MPTINGTEGDDTLKGTGAGTIINGFGGNDAITDGGAGATIDGGAGTDLLVLDRSTLTTDVRLSFDAHGTYSQPSGYSDGTSATNVETVWLVTGAGNDTVYFWNPVGNWVWLSDIWDGGAGSHDQANVYMTNAVSGIKTTVSDDVWMVTANGNAVPALAISHVEYVWLHGSPGADTFEAFNNPSSGLIPGTFWLDGGAGDDTFYGGFSLRPTYLDARSGVTVNMGINTAQYVGASMGSDTLINVTNLMGSTFDDRITGGASGDSIWSDAGNDLVDGVGGDDSIYGGAGNDTIMGGDGSDSLSGDAGNDTLDGGAGNDTALFAGNRSTYTVTQTSPGHYTVSGSTGVDTLSNVEFLKFDDQTMTLIDTPVTPISGTSGADVLAGTSGADTILGGAGDDLLKGNSGDDTLNGEDDSDTLNGGVGNDVLDGGSGVDTAVVAGVRSAYTTNQTSTGHFTVSGPDGTDTLTNIEYLKFDDQTLRLLPGSATTVDFTANPAAYMSAIRDFDGNDLHGVTNWKLIGTADVNGDGRGEHILFNREIGRWAEVATEPDGQTYFSNYGWAGDTRVVGIYIDPLVANGTVVKGSDTDSQRRFQNDLMIDNIHGILGQGDYNNDGLQEVYFSLTDGTAYLHAYMHADGNIQYANYQNKQQVIDYLTTNGVSSSTWSTWFPASQTPIVSSDLASTLLPAAGSALTLAAGS